MNMTVFPQAAKEPLAARTKDAPRILAADDQPHILDAIELLLQPEGYRVERAQSPREVRERVASESYDALLIDLNYTRDTTSGAEGLELLAQLTAHDSSLRIIVMTAWANVDLAVESMRRGACDFIQKPWETPGSSPSCAPRLNSGVRFARPKSWKRKTVCCVRKGGPNSSRKRPRCGRC